MKKIIFNNIGLKILALLIAVIVWWVVINIDDPLVKKTINGVSVELRNDDDLIDKGYILGGIRERYCHNRMGS